MDVKTIKELVSRVNQTLNRYEKYYTSVKRTPTDDPESCMSFEDFLEKRFNYEAFRVPELQRAAEITEGRLFSCVELVDPDVKKRKFKCAKIKILDTNRIPDEYVDLKNDIESIKTQLGGSVICFNSVKKKIRLTINE